MITKVSMTLTVQQGLQWPKAKKGERVITTTNKRIAST